VSLRESLTDLTTGGVNGLIYAMLLNIVELARSRLCWPRYQGNKLLIPPKGLER
jgi:hypothetical protein